MGGFQPFFRFLSPFFCLFSTQSGGVLRPPALFLHGRRRFCGIWLLGERTWRRIRPGCEGLSAGSASLGLPASCSASLVSNMRLRSSPRQRTAVRHLPFSQLLYLGSFRAFLPAVNMAKNWPNSVRFFPYIRGFCTVLWRFGGFGAPDLIGGGCLIKTQTHPHPRSPVPTVEYLLKALRNAAK